MIILYTVVLSTVSAFILFLLTKLMGNKQIAQLTTFDYIIGISLGSIAAEMAYSTDDFEKPLTAMLTFGLIATALSVITNKSIKLRRIIDGTSLILYENGKMFRKNFKKAKLNINEFLTECRIQGFYNIDDIQTVILEPNGRISILAKSASRPVTTRDMNIIPKEEKTPVTIIADGQILKKNLKSTGNNEVWLQKQLLKQDIRSVKEVFYASCDSNNNLSVYTNIEEMPDHDIFS